MTRIYTRKGDDGTTRLADGSPASKADRRIEAYGTVDELNARIGLALALRPAAALISPLKRIQHRLFQAGAQLSHPGPAEQYDGPRVTSENVRELEELIDRLNAELPALRHFVLPGGTPVAAELHVARTVCRRAERAVCRLHESEPVDQALIAYLNRLSDALFVMSRYDNFAAGVAEPTWDGNEQE